MAAIRVFLLTFRRPALLPRALASLRAQTFTDWICELHNDAPEDEAPARLVTQLADPRITLHHHPRNWGAVASFNHAYAGGPEPLAAILEDDNTWDDDFLATAIAALRARPEAVVAWANLRLLSEKPDGTWTHTGRTIWQTTPGDTEARLFHWPQPLQLSDALHSQGAMVYRVLPSRSALVPADTPLAIIESARERLLGGGWLLIPRPLGDFAITLRTSRPEDPAGWMQAQLLVAASYLMAASATPSELSAHWAALRAQRPPSTPLLFHLAFAGVRPFELLRHASLADWLRFIVGTIRHPLSFLRSLRFRSAYPTVWPVLRDAARTRTRETASRTATSSLYRKILSAAPSPVLPP